MGLWGTALSTNLWGLAGYCSEYQFVPADTRLPPPGARLAQGVRELPVRDRQLLACLRRSHGNAAAVTPLFRTSPHLRALRGTALSKRLLGEAVAGGPQGTQTRAGVTFDRSCDTFIRLE